MCVCERERETFDYFRAFGKGLDEEGPPIIPRLGNLWVSNAPKQNDALNPSIHDLQSSSDAANGTDKVLDINKPFYYIDSDGWYFRVI